MSTTIVYRAADKPNPEIWNLNVEHKLLDDEAVPAALEEGWVLHPNDVKQPEAKVEGAGKGK